MDRRAFISTLAGALVASPLAVEAEQGRVIRIGYPGLASTSSDKDLLAAFRQGMQDLGYAKDAVVIEEESAAGRTERLSGLVTRMIQRKIDVFLLAATVVYEVKEALASAPAVFVIADDPVRTGLVADFARPGGSMTGLTSLNIELDAKRLQILKAALPGVRRVGVLTTPRDHSQDQRRAAAANAAHALGLQLEFFQVVGEGDLAHVIDASHHHRLGALVVLGSPPLRGYSGQMARLVAKARLPAVSAWQEFVEAGGLLSYGTNVGAMFRRAAVFVDKILKGANPGDLPIEQATTFELVINLKTAKALGLTMPPSLLARADHVIE